MFWRHHPPIASPPLPPTFHPQLTRCPVGHSYSPLSYAPRTPQGISKGKLPLLANMSSSQCLRRMAVSGATQRPTSLLAQSSKRASGLLRAPAAKRSLSYAAKPSWSSYQALQSQYVPGRRGFHVGTNSKIETDSLRPPTSRASSA